MGFQDVDNALDALIKSYNFRDEADKGLRDDQSGSNEGDESSSDRSGGEGTSAEGAASGSIDSIIARVSDGGGGDSQHEVRFEQQDSSVRGVRVEAIREKKANANGGSKIELQEALPAV
jgi:hypothetical protein